MPRRFEFTQRFQATADLCLAARIIKTKLSTGLVPRLVNSLTYCVALGALAKAPVRRCGGSTSSAGNTGQGPQRHALRESLRALIAALR